MKTDPKIEQGPTVVREAEQPALPFEWGAIKWLCNREIDAEAFLQPAVQAPGSGPLGQRHLQGSG
jgi:hypothetical protein